MNGDVISLSVPARPDYILAVRLAVSAVAERVGFDIEDIEDLKVASAEACILLLAAGAEKIDLRMAVCDGLSLDFMAAGDRSGGADEKDSDGLSQYLLDALVDTCDFRCEGGTVTTVLLKKSLSSR